MKSFKRIFILLLFSPMLFLTSCLENEDLMTSDVKTGGLIVPGTSSFPYKLGETTTINLAVKVPQGPAVSAIKVTSQFYNVVTKKSSNVVPLTTINVGGANATADADVAFSVTYADLSKDIVVDGTPLSAVESDNNIGDTWTLTYTSVVDGRDAINGSKTTIAVANKYAGLYQCVGTFQHPTAGTRDVNEEKFLTPLDAFACWTGAGDLGGAGYFVTVTVDPATNVVTCSTGPDGAADIANYPGENSYYDPADGTFHLSYFYVGGSGNRVMREVWTPIAK